MGIPCDINFKYVALKTFASPPIPNCFDFLAVVSFVRALGSAKPSASHARVQFRFGKSAEFPLYNSERVRRI